MALSDAIRENLPATPVGKNAADFRVAISSVFGDPLNPSTWSGAPANLAEALARLGGEVHGIHPQLPRRYALWSAFQHLVVLHRLPLKGEAIMRMPFARMQRSLVTAETAGRLTVDRVIHTGTFDVPALQRANPRIGHYIYCDHTWNLVLRYRDEGARLRTQRFSGIEEAERSAYAAARHIFTFGKYVRDDLIEHYGIAPDRVTAVGSGSGRIRPYDGPKDHVHGPLLFVAKHMFAEKGGHLAIKAFRLARRRRPDLRMIIVGNSRWRDLVGSELGIHVLDHVSWETLEELYRSASLLMQPMLNDPWGQVYLEALKSKTPVIGLHRNGLPEITENGRHGFMADYADPVVLAELIVGAMADPERLAAMGESGQKHVLANYSWDRTARQIADVIARQ